MKKVVIIGDGALGLCSAYFLAEAGFEVEIVTNSSAHQEDNCSYGNAGMIVPSHFIPLAAPGVIKQGLKWMLNAKSPLYIKPRLDLKLMQWLWNFFKSANLQNVLRAKHLLKDMHLQSRELFAQLEQKHQSFQFKHQGLMMLYNSAKCQDEEENLAEEAQKLGISTKVYSQPELATLEPALRPNVLGGVLYESDAHLHPNHFMKVMKSILIKQGVGFRYEMTIERFQTSNSTIRYALAGSKRIEGDEFLVCAGAWSTSLANQLHMNLPLQGGKGYSVSIPNIPKNLNYPSILCEAKVAMTPMGNSLRIAGTMEIAGTDLSIRKTRLQGIQEQVPNYLSKFDPTWFNGRKVWAGLRPISPDGLPYIGRSNKWTNLSFNTGHAMMGLSLSPISGKLIAELLSTNQTSLDIHVLDPNRF
ncbi:MAG: NAD(P)/FAD-dependent oxidoreductase [Flammeovirgaceae bacterium]